MATRILRARDEEKKIYLRYNFGLALKKQGNMSLAVALLSKLPQDARMRRLDRLELAQLVDTPDAPGGPFVSICVPFGREQARCPVRRLAQRARELLERHYPATSRTFLDKREAFAASRGSRSTSLRYPTCARRVGAKLLVCDAMHNRVLIWNSVPTANGAAADVVIGQTSMSGSGGGIGLAQMNQPQDLWSDGTKLYIADYYNNRILAYGTIPTSNGAAATAAISNPSGMAAVRYPKALTGSANRLVLADVGNNRVLVWNSLPLTNVAANVAIGQPNLTATTASTFTPYGVFLPPVASPPLMVVDGQQTYYFSALPAANGSAGMVTVPGTRSTSIFGDGTKKYFGFVNAVSIWDDISTHVAGSTVVKGTPDGIIGQRSVGETNTNAIPIDAKALDGPTAVTICNGRFFVADEAANRVVGWLARPTRDDQPADFVLGQADLSSYRPNRGGSLAANTLSGPAGVFCDGTHLFVADTDNSRILVWNSLPAVTGTPADFVLGTTSLTGMDFGCDAVKLDYPRFVWSDGTYVYAANTGRMVMWDHFPTASGEASHADVFGNCSGSSNADIAGLTGDSGHLVVLQNTTDYLANHSVLIWAGLPSSFASPTVTLTQPYNDSGLGGAWLGNGKLYLTLQATTSISYWNTIPATSGTLGVTPALAPSGTFGTLFAPSAGISGDDHKIFVTEPSARRVVLLPLPGT